MKGWITLIFISIGFLSVSAKADRENPVVALAPDVESFIFEESGQNFLIDQNPGNNFRASFIANRVVYGLRFAEDFELTPASFKVLREEFLKNFPQDEFGRTVLLTKEEPSGKKEITWTFGKIRSEREIEIRGQVVITYSGFEEDTGYPLISGISIKSSSEAEPVDKNLILKLSAEDKKKREQFAPIPPPPPIVADDKPAAEWKTYTIGKTDMKIIFPIEPEQAATDVLKGVEQYTSKAYIADYGFNFVYFISILKFSNMPNVDSVTFLNSITTIVDNFVKSQYAFKVKEEKAQQFKNCMAKSTRAMLTSPDNYRFKYDGLSVKRKNYVVFMFVLTDPNYVDIDGRIPRFFNSLAWDH